jgi:hypothetical protein
VLGAVDPRRLGVQTGEELAGIDVTPLPFLGMVADREFGMALGAQEPSSLRVLDPHVNPATFSGQLDPAHLPW